MDCPKCMAELIWGNDFDVEDEDSEFTIFSDYHCPDCATEVRTYS